MLILIKHRGNIYRLLHHEESKVGFKDKLKKVFCKKDKTVEGEVVSENKDGTNENLDKEQTTNPEEQNLTTNNEEIAENDEKTDENDKNANNKG